MMKKVTFSPFCGIKRQKAPPYFLHLPFSPIISYHHLFFLSSPIASYSLLFPPKTSYFLLFDVFLTLKT